MPSSYTPQQISKLACLIEPYVTLDKLRQAVLIGLNDNLEKLALGPNLQVIILELCQKVNELDRVEDFIKGLNSNLMEFHPDLSSSLRIFLSQPTLGPDGPYSALLITKMPPQPMIDRRDLRSFLVQVATRGSSYGCISISGPPASGKSHSASMVRLVAETRGIDHVKIDVVNDTRALSLREVLGKIALQFRIAITDFRTLLVDDPTEAQAADRFVDWISGLSREFTVGKQYWLTLDGLDRPAATATREILVPLLVRAIADGNLINVKLFLLGDDARRVREARLIVLHEDAPQLTGEEIKLFLKRYAAEKGWDIPDPELQSLLQHVIADTRWPFDHKAMTAILERLQTVLPIVQDPALPTDVVIRGKL